MTWIPVSERYPEITKENPYPTCWVWRECMSEGIMRGVGSMMAAELRLLGGDPNRPYWVYPEKGRTSEALENSSWKVTYWMELPEPPYKFSLEPGAKNGTV
jgi:Protein of unknown function (DUF551)